MTSSVCESDTACIVDSVVSVNLLSRRTALVFTCVHHKVSARLRFFCLNKIKIGRASTLRLQAEFTGAGGLYTSLRGPLNTDFKS